NRQVSQIAVFVLLYLSTTYNVQQTPPSIIKKVGQSVSSQIHCSHNMSIFERILWYKQDEHRAPQFLGYLNLNFPYPEEDVKGKISFNGNGQKYSNLTISNVSVTDSAVYFCAGDQQHHIYSDLHIMTVLLRDTPA
uniref:Ig-like domain-containing protein n=1 Tax=Neolamprologus brichardi TaxID=32507 RepID=A0A3Q4GEK6_NEOBR